MRNILIAVFLLLFLCTEAHSQRWTRERRHITFGLGASGFMGDLGGANAIGTQGIKDFDFSATRPAMMFGYRYMMFRDLSFSGNLSSGFVYGNDKFTKEDFRNNRNAHFRSPIIELSGTSELYLVRLQKTGRRFRAITGNILGGGFVITGYVFAGLGATWFNPQGYFDRNEYTGTAAPESLPSNGWYNLRPLRTEGQGFFATRSRYVPFALVIPFGFGATMLVNSDISIGIQYGFRKTFTDYIDDVSKTYVDPKVFGTQFTDPQRVVLAEHFANPTNNQLGKAPTEPGLQRGNPFNTDAYMFAFVTVYYKLPYYRRYYNSIRF